MDDGLFGFIIFVCVMVASIAYQKRKLAMEEAAEEEKSAPTPKVIIKDLTKPRVKTDFPALIRFYWAQQLCEG